LTSAPSSIIKQGRFKICLTKNLQLQYMQQILRNILDKLDVSTLLVFGFQRGNNLNNILMLFFIFNLISQSPL